MFGFAREDLGGGQRAWVAGPEKALLDLVHLEPRADTVTWLEELRLQGPETLDLDRLGRHARDMGRPKLLRAAAAIEKLARQGEVPA